MNDAAKLEYPQPTRTSANAPLLDAWARGELMLQQCEDCAARVFFPRELCPSCWSPRLAWRPSSGQGTVVSFARIHRHIHAAFAAEVPTLLAEVKLDDGWLMIARVLASGTAAIASGKRVELVPMPDAARFPLPTFRVVE
jgi:uncharacterized OB-fold protein